MRHRELDYRLEVDARDQSETLDAERQLPAAEPKAYAQIKRLYRTSIKLSGEGVDQRPARKPSNHGWRRSGAASLWIC